VPFKTWSSIKGSQIYTSIRVTVLAGGYCHLEQGWSMKEQEAEKNAFFNKISELEIRVENQEQYSRRTSLRFHNIKVPVDERGRIIHPVDTDDLVLQVCITKLSLDISKTDIGRSHVIGKVNKGKSQVIVRFLCYRTRNSVHQ